MKKNITYIAPEKLRAIVSKKGLTSRDQAGFVRIEGPGGHRVYFARGLRVGRADFSGFEMPAGTPGIIDLLGESFGGVRQRIDFTRPEADVLATFAAVLDHMKTLPKLKKAPRKARAPQAEAAAPKEQAPAAEPAPVDPAQARREKIMARAQELMAGGLAVASAVAQAQAEAAAS
jgi:hypothetical protein